MRAGIITAGCLRLAAACLLLGLSACAGDHTGALLMPAAPVPADPQPSAAELAAERDHQRLAASFGGELRSPALQRLLGEMTERLVKATERPDEAYRISILNSPAVNAFALPSGRLYVTRGLLALANDTAEVAAVLAHEIAHVSLRHASARTELEARSVLVSRVVAEVLNDPVASAFMRDQSRFTIASFSRGQELEADQVGIRTMARAGYDPHGAPRFLDALGRWSGLRADAGEAASAADMLASHPGTPERLALATQGARRIGAPGLGEGDRARYLGALAGITFGDNPSDGVVRGRRFIHARLGVAFEAPEGIPLENTPRAVTGASADGQRRLLFDAIEAGDQSLEDLLRSTWNDATDAGRVETATVNGWPAAVGVSRGKEWTFRLAAVRIGATAYRLIIASRSTDDMEEAFRRALDSVRQVGPDEARTVSPLRLELVTAVDGDTPATLAGRMAVADRPLERFLVLNGLDRASILKPGERYKVVVE